MHSPYTTTITDAATRRGIAVTVIDETVPIFTLSYKSKSVRCYRSLTDRVGAVTFHLTQNKHLANRFLRSHGFQVPHQERYTGFDQALKFLHAHRRIVVKPCTQWGGRGIATHITNARDLKSALRSARRFEPDILLEQMVPGNDHRLVYIDYRFVCALQRRPAFVTGNGRDTIGKLIRAKNKLTRRIDPVHAIPLDRETKRYLQTCRRTFETIPAAGSEIPVRQTANYHTGGTVQIITGQISNTLRTLGRRIVKAAELPVAGIDFLHDPQTGSTYVLELAPDLAISPRGGDIIAEHFIDYLFPETRRRTHFSPAAPYPNQPFSG